VYVIVFQEGQHLRSRLTKICDSFMGRSVEIPHNLGQAEIARRIHELEKRIIEARHIIGMTRLRLKDYLREMQKVCLKKENESANTISLLEVYKLFLQKEKLLYSTMNKFKKEDKLYLGFCWIPRSDNESILR
jgi:vacuolar-type H+-ATPase subunit I/STV1